MTALLQAAFGVQQDQIKGPAWLRDFAAMPFYDIVATMPADTTLDQYEMMMQNLLVERFHMVFHHETRNFPGYELVVDKGDKGGPTLKEVTANPDPVADGFPAVPGTRTIGSLRPTVHQRIKFQEYTMRSFASNNLPFLIGHAQGKILDDGFFQPRVIDKTGLIGKYTFILEFDCTPCTPLAATAPTREAPAASEPGGFPDLFGAIQKQLGLRLEKAADIPMDVIVVENLDKIPTGN
jgi:uncharacterized protein (TIGR03435 family)